MCWTNEFERVDGVENVTMGLVEGSNHPGVQNLSVRMNHGLYMGYQVGIRFEWLVMWGRCLHEVF